ncbi:MAG: hypothetical protein RMJ87_13925 [Cytophagales bacterium]|nr:hypothetical protein [Bernardetiaceae bacterium]MDW8206121.1 hypothetical protein [Cytophagales bacterium]
MKLLSKLFRMGNHRGKTEGWGVVNGQEKQNARKFHHLPTTLRIPPFTFQMAHAALRNHLCVRDWKGKPFGFGAKHRSASEALKSPPRSPLSNSEKARGTPKKPIQSNPFIQIR